MAMAALEAMADLFSGEKVVRKKQKTKKNKQKKRTKKKEKRGVRVGVVDQCGSGWHEACASCLCKQVPGRDVREKVDTRFAPVD